MIINDLTIVIPSYNNRRFYLKRAIHYYNLIDIKFKIIIVDSSTNEQVKDRELPFFIDYIHLPDENYFNKIHYALSQVKTEFTILFPDDCFLILENLMECVSFLKRSANYSSVQGGHLHFLKNDLTTTFFPSLTQTIGLDINQDSYDDRVHTLFSNYIYLIYSVFRTEVIKNIFSFYNKRALDEIYLSSSQYIFDLFAIFHGNHIVLPIVLSADEISFKSGTYTLVSIRSLINEEEHKNFIMTFIQSFLTSNGLNQHSARENVEKIENEFNNYFFNSETPLKEKEINIIKNKTLKKIINSFPFIMKFKFAFSEFVHIKRRRNRFYKDVKNQMDYIENKNIKIFNGINKDKQLKKIKRIVILFKFYKLIRLY